MMSTSAVNAAELEAKVKDMYESVAEHPDGTFHFDMGRELALRLGYDASLLDRVPADAIRSFAGVGHFFDLAALREGERVLDLGSGSGTDLFLAALLIGPRGRAIGVDMTAAQLAKADRLRRAEGLTHVEVRAGYIEAPPVGDAAVDCVISNGVINLSADKMQVFREAARVLVPGGRIALADIVTEKPLPDGITCDATLWAACIGGAMQQDAYVAMIEAAGLRVARVVENPAYRFLSENAVGASRKYGVKSVSILATKP
jgi:arsenite methyltransferase